MFRYIQSSFLLFTLVLPQSLLYSQGQVPPEDIFGLCTATLNGEVYGIGEYRDEDKQHRWAALKGTEILDSTKDSITISNILKRTYCWIDHEERMHFIWGFYGSDGPQKSTRLYHGMYDLNPGSWSVPDVIWEAPPDISFDMSNSQVSFFLNENKDAYLAFKINGNNERNVYPHVGFVFKKAHEKAWGFKSVEWITVSHTSGQQMKVSAGATPGFYVDKQGRYYMAFMFIEHVPSVGTRSSVYVTTSDDEGESWNTAEFATGTETSGDYRPSIWGSGKLKHLMWFESTPDDEYRYAYTFSTDGGRSWNAKQYLESQIFNAGTRTCMDSSGRKHLVVGRLYGESLEYFVLENQKWHKVTDLTTLYSDPEFYGLIEPSLSCDGHHVFLNALKLGPPASGMITPQEMILRRIDPVFTQVVYSQ